MIHNQFAQPQELFFSYEVDIVPNQAAEQTWQMEPAYPVWLDVRPSLYPVFNTKRDFPAPGATTCTWPDENCADHDPWGEVTCNQGDTSCTPSGNTERLPAAGGSYGRHANFQGGTLVAIAGHVHPGGLTVQVDLERSGQVPRRIFTSEGVYWNHTDHASRDGPPTSWDMSMTAQSLPEWGVRVEPLDRFRITATYDVARQSTYENMGIVVAWLAPTAPPTLGIDPFAAELDTAARCPSGGLLSSPPKLCDKGEVTHGHLAEAEVYGGANGTSLSASSGAKTSDVSIASFQYFPGGLDTIALTGIPTIPLGQSVGFSNADAAANVYHSVTSCAYPCNGPTGIAYPLSDGRSDQDNPIDFDSGQLGYGPPEIGPAKNTAQWQLPVTSENRFAPGVYTYFCRVHPFMRGAFEVTER
jgi:plastocyanin